MSDICENTTEIELESLEAIYVNELTYSRNADGQLEKIELLVHPATGHDVTKQYVCMTLVFTVSSEYPNEPPEIVIRNPRGLGEEEVSSLVEDMVLKAEEMKGEAMLYTLIEMAKDSITEGNIPHCPCVVCLEHFHQRDIFHRTACYHYFHNRCLYKYLLHAQAQLEVEEKEASERRHLDVGSSDEDKTMKIICPVCRSPLDEESLMVTCSQEELEEDEKAEEFVIPPDLKEQQRKMSEMYEQQKAKGGIIDLEHEKNKYLLNSEDRMPVRGQRPSPVTINDDATKPAASKHGPRENNTDRPNSHSRQYGSSQQYRKGRGRGRGNFYSGRSYHEWSDYEHRPGFRLKTEDGAGRRTNHPPGSGSRRMKDLVETELRTEEASGQRKTSEERRESEKTKRILEKERRMKDNNTGMKKGHTDGSFSEVHRLDGGFTRTDMRERLEERYDHQRMDERQKVDRRQDNSDRYERRDNDKFNDREIASREPKQMEDGKVTETDIEFKKVENDRGSSARSYRTGGGHKREEVSEGLKTYSGGSYQTHQKYYSNRKEKDNLYNKDDELNETEKDIIRKQLPKRHTETNLANNEVEPAKSMCESENESRSYRNDRFDEVQVTSGGGRRDQMYEASTARASSAVRDKVGVPESNVRAASGVYRPLTEGRNASFKDQDDEHAGYGRRDDRSLRQGYDNGSSGYQRSGGSYRGRGSGSGPKQRGGKFHEERGNYAGYSERSRARHDRPQQQHHQHQHHQQQQWHRNYRHGEERERVDRNVRAAKERHAEDELNSTTTGQGACGTDITSETGSKDDEEADLYYHPVRPQRLKSTCEFSGNASEVNTTWRLISAARQDLLDNDSAEDEAKACYGKSRCYFDKDLHKHSGSEIIGYDNSENDDNYNIKAHKTYPVYSEAELKTHYVGFDEVDQENWDEEMDIYHYERYKIRPQHLEEYNKQAIPRKKYYENKIQEKHEQQNMIKEEERRILREKSLKDFMDNEMESPVKTESKKDVHMKSILDTFKEEKAKELGTSVMMSESNGSQREIIAILSESAVSFESEVDRLYKSTKQNIDGGYISQDSRRCKLLANHEIPHTSNCLITSWLEEKENNNHMYSKGLNRKKTVNTKSEDTKTETFNTIGQGQYSTLSVSDNEDFGITTSCSSLDDMGFVSDVVCSSKCSLGKTAESKGACYTGVSKTGYYRYSGVCLRGDHTDIGAGGVSHRGDCMDIGDSHIGSHRDFSVSCRISHRYDGVSYRANHRGEDPCLGEHRDKGVPVTSEARDIGVSHIDRRHGGDLCMGSRGSNGVSSSIHRDSGAFCREEHRVKGVPLTSGNKDRGVSHRDENPTYRGVGGPPTHEIEHSSMPSSFIKNLKKAPPLKFPKKNRQGANSDSSSQMPVVQPVALAETAQEGGASGLGGITCAQSRQQTSEENNSKCTVDNCVVTSSKIILSETTPAMLNARPPNSFTDLSTALLNSYMVNSVLSGNLLGGNLLSGNLLNSNIHSSHQMGVGLNPSLLSLYGTYSGNFSNGYLSDIYPLMYNNVQNVGIGNGATMNTCGGGDVAPVNCLNTCGMGDVVPVNCVVTGGGKTLGDSGVAAGKENINFSPVVTK